MPIEQRREITIADEKGRRLFSSSLSREEAGIVIDAFDKKAESDYVRKLDFYLLLFLSVIVDRSNLGNAKTDGMDKDLDFTGGQYSLLILLFYIPNGLCDLPLNLLTKKWSGRVMLPSLMVGWGAMALFQCALHNFAGILVIRLLLGAFEVGFFVGVVFYLTLFYTYGELGFRIALFFGSALLAGAFSGQISFGVFHIDHAKILGWKLLFLIDGAFTVLNVAHFAICLPPVPMDSTYKSFKEWNTWKMLRWCIVAFTYPVAFSTTSNFLPQIVQRLGYSVVKTNLLTVALNAVGFVALLYITYSSDYFRERMFHICGALCISPTGLIIFATVDVLGNKAVA
ncbi:hypothetical protein G6011_02048 [Alternaria panax]|uniref:MFS general substrate transporter n=1 Tax=Alternaria panax TaxID=48097 RepID=A0AAD4FDP5_9PLEO|nr:hypothetical protein G6011_02048 [Alternaria panax]